MNLYRHEVFIFGIEGNMGRRYKSILEWLGIPVRGIDKNDSLSRIDFIKNPTHYIIATPTNTHQQIIEELDEYLKNKPSVRILCEKPVIKTMDIAQDFKPIRSLISSGHYFYMVNNYCYYPGMGTGRGKTSYDYYNSGGDGLIWDCIQLVHLASSDISLSNRSPYWQTFINGTCLIKDYIDDTYVSMLADFLDDTMGLLWGYKDIELATKKVIAYEKRSNRNTGKDR